MSIRPLLNQRKYVALDLRILKAIPDDCLEQVVRDYVSVQIAHGSEEREFVIGALAPGFRAIITTLGVAYEVNNGGFLQYFWNTEGRLAAHAEEGFRRIGAPRFADLLNRAFGIWQEEQPIRDSLRRRNLIEWCVEVCKYTALGGLDREFWALAEESDLSRRRIEYIRAHPTEFITRY
jgi:hypothetical protein